MTKKILVLSDSHEKTEYMNKALALNADADLIIHLGDGASDLSKTIPGGCNNYVFIEGNGEYFGSFSIDRRYRPQREALIEFDGKKLFLAHGHNYDVKWGLEKLIAHAYAEGADVILFGHTHVPLIKYIPEGSELDYVGKSNRPLLVFNPGSIGLALHYTFGLLTFQNGEILPSHGTIR